eukprot:CAMPEP_0194755424 /NCGR_PEP_ID=MMETSP0323_2-20130528/9301_1 /TAXON_ID=2866 ORGANISM="Crypthecodinium cohnii, Strain Seligo" /NCGR_SAMPLE_ID=MMETSP0323_2 /ASSEMBLY_ACC=CAM_ASM_000346 /LENGTH=98 /DNA_ID=CAMNT_0039674473 /DNA_START=91 /DNA_END=383 /DNA_ORIENTATION=-
MGEGWETLWAGRQASKEVSKHASKEGKKQEASSTQKWEEPATNDRLCARAQKHDPDSRCEKERRAHAEAQIEQQTLQPKEAARRRLNTFTRSSAFVCA